MVFSPLSLVPLSLHKPAPLKGSLQWGHPRFLFNPARRRNRRGMMLTVRHSSSAHSQVQGGEPWRIFWAGAPPFSLEEKMGGAYTLPQPLLMLWRKTVISDDGQTPPLDDANL